MSLTSEIIERKLEYLRMLASIQGTNLSMMKWEAILHFIHMNLGSNVAYRFLMDMYLHLNYNLDPSKWTWHPLDFEKMFTPEFPPHPYKPQIGSMSSLELENSLWGLRYIVSEKEGYYYKRTGLSLAKHITWFKKYLTRRGVHHHIRDGIVDILALIEGKCKITTYVGMAIVDISVVMPEHIEVRNPKDWRTTITVDVASLYETHIGFGRVGYCRVTVPYGAPYLAVKKALTDHFTKAVTDFRQRSGMVHGSPQEVLYQRVFMWQREQQYHHHGGNHQIVLQTIIHTVKKLLDKRGIMVQARMAYISFAQELYYLKYEPHRLWKRYKTTMTLEDVIDKYKSGGCDEGIMMEIKGRVSP